MQMKYLFLLLCVLVVVASCSKEPTPDNRELYFHFETKGRTVNFYPLLPANAIAWPARNAFCDTSHCDMGISFSAEEVDGSAMIAFFLHDYVDTNMLVWKDGYYKYKNLESMAQGLAEGNMFLNYGTSEPYFDVQIDINGDSWSTQKGWALRTGGISADNFNQFRINAITKFNLDDVDDDDFEYSQSLKFDSVEHIIKLDVTFQLKLLNDWATDSLLVTNGRAKFFLVN